MEIPRFFPEWEYSICSIPFNIHVLSTSGYYFIWVNKNLYPNGSPKQIWYSWMVNIYIIMYYLICYISS